MVEVEPTGQRVHWSVGGKGHCTLYASSRITGKWQQHQHILRQLLRTRETIKNKRDRGREIINKTTSICYLPQHNHCQANSDSQLQLSNDKVRPHSADIRRCSQQWQCDTIGWGLQWVQETGKGLVEQPRTTWLSQYQKSKRTPGFNLLGGNPEQYSGCIFHNWNSNPESSLR